MQTIVESNAIQVKDDEKILGQSNQLVRQAEEFKIEDAVTCQQAAEMAKTLKAFIEGPGTYHDREIEMAHSLHKSLTAKRNAIIEGPKKAYKLLKDRIAQWQWEQEQKRLEAQRKAEEEARRKESEKQAKIQEKIDEERRRAQEAENEADRLKAQAKIDSLEEKKENVYVAPKIVAPVSTPSGTSVNFDYEPIIEDKAAVPEMYKVVDVAMLKKMQKQAKGQLEVPGVRWNKKPIGTIRKTA